MKPEAVTAQPMPTKASQKSGGNTLAPPATRPTIDKTASDSPKNISLMFLLSFSLRQVVECAARLDDGRVNIF